MFRVRARRSERGGRLIPAAALGLFSVSARRRWRSAAGVGGGGAGEVVDARVEAVVDCQQRSPGRLFTTEVADLVGQVVAQRPGAATAEAWHAGQVDPRLER